MNLHKINHTANNAIDMELLMRKYLAMEHDENTLKQNMMNMTAEIVFGMDALALPPRQKEKELWNRLYKPVGFGGSAIGRWFGASILLLGGLACLFLWRNKNVPLHKSQASIADFQETVRPEKPKDKTLRLAPATNAILSLRPLARTQGEATEPKKAIALLMPNKKDLVPKSIAKGGTGSGAARPKFVLDTSASMFPAPDWEVYGFKDRETPTKFLKGLGDFQIDTINSYFREGKKYFAHSFYSGAPLRQVPDDMVYVNYGEAVMDQVKKTLPPSKYVPPQPIMAMFASRFYGDTQNTKVHLLGYVTDNIPQTVWDQELLPFYFRKYEVTNGEYRMFLKWVAVQHGFDTYEAACKNAEGIKKAFAYTFFGPNIPALKGLPSTTVNVYPDTGCFVRDFPWSKDDKMVHEYFTSPVYDDYPVCGITYWQAMAYLDWKTKAYQTYLDANNIPFTVSFELPTDIEWEMAANLKNYPSWEKSIIAYNPVYDNDWVCNLVLAQKGDTQERFEPLDNILNHDVIYAGNWVIDGYCYTGPADLSKHERQIRKPPADIHLSASGISWMDGNVSEWMQETYQGNWLPMFQKHLQYLAKWGNEGDRLAMEIEQYFDKRNDKDGHLVRGGNFYDERYSVIDGKNLAGTMLKRFVSPSREYSTLGFRYVLRIVKKEE